MIGSVVAHVLQVFGRIITLLVFLYMACFVVWSVLRFGFGDRWWWLFLLNSFAVYLFLPLVAVIIFAIAARRIAPALFSLAAIVLFISMYGGLLIPHGATVQPGERTLTVMSYNLLASNSATDDVVAAIRTADADVVAFQELAPAVAIAVQNDLREEYPFQVLDPRPDVTGLGVISRYPLSPTNRTLPGTWIGTPQILTLMFDDTPVTLLNFHNVSVPLGVERWREQVTNSIRVREQQADVLVQFVASEPGPLIVATDFNASDQSAAYRRVTTVLQDAWRAAGWGLGHTFPGSSPEGGSPIRVLGRLVPMWLVRIDYVFYSFEFEAIQAEIGPWDGGSDHRPVLVRLKLND